MAPAQSNVSSPNALEKNRSLSPGTAKDEVRVIGISEYEQAANSLSEAFAEDDVARYFVDPDDMASYSRTISGSFIAISSNTSPLLIATMAS